MHWYRAYGIGLRSQAGLAGFSGESSEAADAFTANLPGAVPAATGEVLRRRDEDDNSDALEVRRPSPDALHLSFADGASFLVDAAARRIDGTWNAPLTLDDALVYLVGPVLGAALRLLRRSVLHASAVEVDGRAVLVMGEAGAGKSTMTAALVDGGLPLVSEDVCALDFDDRAGARVFRGGTRVKLWPESVMGLRGKDDALPLLVPASLDWHKRFLDCSARMTAAESLPIAAIVTLERTTDVDAPRVTELRAHDKLLCLLANGYAARMVRPDDRADELARVSALAQQAPLLRLTYPDRFDALADAVAAVRDVAAAAPGDARSDRRA